MKRRDFFKAGGALVALPLVGEADPTYTPPAPETGKWGFAEIRGEGADWAHYYPINSYVMSQTMDGEATVQILTDFAFPEATPRINSECVLRIRPAPKKEYVLEGKVTAATFTADIGRLVDCAFSFSGRLI